MHWLAEATALARRARWPGPLGRRLRRVRWHWSMITIGDHPDATSIA